MTNYELVNPRLMGSFQTIYNSNSSAEAARDFWSNFTSNKYIAGNVPMFAFTMKEEGNANLHHFEVSEQFNNKNAEGKSTATFTIKRMNINLSNEILNKFNSQSEIVYKKALDSVQTGGGGHRKKRYKDDSTSSSSSSSSSSSDGLYDYFNHIRIKSAKKPFTYWWYTPSIYNIPDIFFPSFRYEYAPLYTQWWLIL
jgi:hypothetical protein